MAAPRRTAIIGKHSKIANEEAPNCIVLYNADPNMAFNADPNVIYFVVVGVGQLADKKSPTRSFIRGEYIFQLTMPEEYPAKPPSVRACTPNGVYDPTATKICISCGEFHANDTGGTHGERGWRPVLGIRGFVQEIVNGLMFSDGFSGIGIHSPIMPASERARLAAESLEYNRKHFPEIVRAYEQFAADTLGGADAALGDLIGTATADALEGTAALREGATRVELTDDAAERLEEEIRRGTSLSAAAGLLLGRRAD